MNLDWDLERLQGVLQRAKETGGWEALDYDFKEKINFEAKEGVPDTFSKAVARLANTLGGTIIVGVSKTGDIVGWDLEREIENRLRDTLKARLKPNIPRLQYQQLTSNDKTLLLIHVAQSEEPLRTIDNRYLWREGTGATPMPHDILIEKIKLFKQTEMALWKFEKDLITLSEGLDEWKNVTIRNGHTIFKNDQTDPLDLIHYIKPIQENLNMIFDFLRANALLEAYYRLTKNLTHLLNPTNLGFAQHNTTRQYYREFLQQYIKVRKTTTNYPQLEQYSKI